MKKPYSFTISEIGAFYPELFQNLKRINRKQIYQRDDGKRIYVQSSKIHDHKTYSEAWHAIEWNVLEQVDLYCLIVDHLGFFLIPIEVIKKYSKYASSKDTKRFHVHFQISPELKFIVARNTRFDHPLDPYFYYIRWEETNDIDIINEESNEETLKKALAFKDLEQQYLDKVGIQRLRIESKKQKERIAKLENHTCQICGFQYEYKNSLGKTRWIIEVDHIRDKSKGGGEEIDNLLVLCPNCHAKKTYGAIKINKNYTYSENNVNKELLHDNHLKTT